MPKQSAYFSVGRTLSSHDVKDVKTLVSRLPGVLSVSVSDMRNSVAVDFDSTGISRQGIQRALLDYQDGFSLKKEGPR